MTKFSVHGTEEFLYEEQANISSKIKVRVQDTMATHRISIQYKNRWGCSKKTFLDAIRIADMVPKTVSPPCTFKADYDGDKVNITWRPPAQNHGYVAHYQVSRSCHLCNVSTHLTSINFNHPLMFSDDCQGIKANPASKYRYTVWSVDCNGSFSQGVTVEVFFRQRGCLGWLLESCHCKKKTA